MAVDEKSFNYVLGRVKAFFISNYTFLFIAVFSPDTMMASHARCCLLLGRGGVYGRSGTGTINGGGFSIPFRLGGKGGGLGTPIITVVVPAPLSLFCVAASANALRGEAIVNSHL